MTWTKSSEVAAGSFSDSNETESWVTRQMITGYFWSMMATTNFVKEDEST